MRRLLIWSFVIVVIVVAGAGAERGIRLLGRSRTYQLFGRVIARVEVTEPVVALSFDDGPTPAVMDEILRVLAERDVRSTFFVNGRHLEANPGAGQRLVDAGHELGNHTYSHARMIFKSLAFVRDEVERTDALIRREGHRGEIYFRPPFGVKLVGLPWFLGRTGRTTVMWDLEPDSSSRLSESGAALAAHVVEHARPGSIILLHVWYPARRTSLDAVPLLIDQLHAKAFRFATVGELVRLGGGG
jgi:peptidoglycan/xylan/chitin deacetylase (PgdA/CDA1 family)